VINILLVEYYPGSIFNYLIKNNMEARFEKFFTDFFKEEGAGNALIDEISKRPIPYPWL